MRNGLLAILAAGAAAILAFGSRAAEPHHHGGAHLSPYAGQENRTIKTFSAEDIDDLENGRGWGLAKAAELNGIPGPAHLLEMKEEIGLTPAQSAHIRRAYDDMRDRAVPLGKRLIALERELNVAFARRDVDAERLRALLDEIGRVRSDLRYVHLAAHLGTPDILTAPQMAVYNRLRGYDTGASRPHGGHD